MRIVFSMFLAALLSSSAKAQTITFEKLDSLSTIISTLEKQTDGKAYKDEKGNVYTLSFPGEDFKIYFYNKLATKAVYKEANGKEILALTENIDFSKATGLSVSDNYKGVAYVQLDFPAGHLKTQIIENGALVKTINEKKLEFFCSYGTADESKKIFFDRMLNDLYSLSTQLKIERNLMTKNDVKNELADWGKISNGDFIKKYPKSLLSTRAYQKEEQRKAARRVEIDNNLVDLRANLKDYKKKRGLWLPVYGIGALAGGYLSYTGFTSDQGNENVNTVLGVGGAMMFILGTTAYFASNSISYKPTIRNLKNKIDSYEQEKRQLSYLEIAPCNNRIMGNYYAGAAVRLHF